MEGLIIRFCIASGKAHFYFHGQEKIVTAGNIVIYRPKEEQRYYYYGVDHTEVYWVHFTGNNVKNILRQYGINDDMHVIHTGTSLEFKNIFLPPTNSFVMKLTSGFNPQVRHPWFQP